MTWTMGLGITRGAVVVVTVGGAGLGGADTTVTLVVAAGADREETTES